MMERQTVSSSNITSIGWEDKILEVEFNNGGVYQYDGVPEQIYQGLMKAESPGKYLNQHVKNVFPYRKISG